MRREDLVGAVEESPLLEDVTRERLVGTVTDSKELVSVAVICKEWKIAIVLQ
jgi:hypothetical protein